MLHGTRIAPDESAFDFARPSQISVAEGPGTDGLVTVPDAHLLFNGDFQRFGPDLKIVGADGKSFLVPDYFRAEKRPTLLSPEGAALTPDVVEALAGPLAPGQYAQAGAQTSDQPAIGRVEQVEGNATIVRNGVAMAANQGDVVRKGDVVQTGDGKIAVLFSDGSTFSLSANARMVLNDFVYQAGGANNAALISLVQGTIGFVAGQVAKTGDMRVDTPVATMGIRGTAVLVEITANNGQTKFSVLVEPDGTTGSFNLYDKSSGTLIGTVNNSQIGWVVSPAGPLQVIAQQVQKTPGEVQQELNYFQQIFDIFNQGQQNPFDPNQHTTNPQSTKTAGSSQFLVADTNNSSGNGGNGSTVTVTVTGNGGNGNTPNIDLLNDPEFINFAPIALPDGGQVPPNVLPPASHHVIEAGIDGPGKEAAAGNVLGNDHDPNPGDFITLTQIAAISPQLHGALQINSSGAYVYTLNNDAADYLAQGEVEYDVFRYTITDAFGATATATLTFVIQGTNDAPVIFCDDPVAAALIETAGQTGSQVLLKTDGAISFTDVDISDNDHEVTFTVAKSGVTNGLALCNDGLLALFDTCVIQTGEDGTDGMIKWDFSAPDHAFDYLAAGEVLMLTYTLALTDDFGATDTQTVTVTVTGTNDAPVISATSDVAGAVTESGHLTDIDGAGPEGGLEPTISTEAVTDTLVSLLSDPDDVSPALTTVQDALEVDFATAIAIVWDYLDDIYVSAGPNQMNVNEAFVRLGVAYVEYLQAGGMPLTEVIAKYTSDGQDAGNDPDRVQSLHDNLLGNLSTAALTQRFGNTETFATLTNLVSGVDADLLTRPYYSGNESTSDTEVRDWDALYGYDMPTATGQFVASDVDNGAVLTWSTDTTAGTYGSFTVNALTGKWTYRLDDSRTETQALADGKTANETFTVKVTDQYGGFDTAEVTITVHGTNDAPVILTDNVRISHNPQTGVTIASHLDVVDVDAACDETFTVKVNAQQGVLAPVGDYCDEDPTGNGMLFHGTLNEIRAGLESGAIYTAPQYNAEPNGNSNLIETVTLTVEDGKGGSDTTNFIFSVYGENTANLAGTDQKDVIFGTGHADTLTGGAGDDTLIGGASADTFVFSPGDGCDAITDFSPSEGDQIDLSAFSNLDCFADLQNYLSVVGNDTVITFSSSHKITVQNTVDNHHTTLAMSDFLFHA